LIARKLAKNADFQSSFFLGKIEFENQNNDKAIYFLNEAMKIDSNNLELVRLKGVLSFNIGSYREASLAMGKIVVANPGDTEAIYYLGISLFRINKFVDAVKYLSMVRNVPQYQIDVEYTLATIYKKKGDLSKAIEVLVEVLDSVKKGTIVNFPPNKACDIYYLLGDCYAASRETNNALAAFQEVVNINPRYKDASFRVEHCSQLSENTLLERFLAGSVNDFTSICKMFVKYYIAKYSHLRGSVKFFSSDINSRGEMEIRAEVSSGKYATVVYFIFFRTNSTIGDFTLRSVYNMLKEEKVDKGVCITAGTFSDTAIHFMESRMLDGVDKVQLSKILQEMTPLIHKKNV
jgi:tetratricopeptide (TPR) repeat protein